MTPIIAISVDMKQAIRQHSRRLRRARSGMGQTHRAMDHAVILLVALDNGSHPQGVADRHLDLPVEIEHLWPPVG